MKTKLPAFGFKPAPVAVRYQRNSQQRLNVNNIAAQNAHIDKVLARADKVTPILVAFAVVCVTVNLGGLVASLFM